MTDARSNNGKEDDVRGLPIDSLREPVELYPRIKPDTDVIARYRDILGDLPPITVTISDDEELDRIIVPGVHRKRAFEAEGRKTIPCKLVPVDARAEILALATRSNTAHGLPLTAEERRHVAEELWRQDMDKKQIAAVVGRSLRTVNRWLESREEERRTRQREEVARLHDKEGRTFTEIAGRLGLSPRTVRRRYEQHKAESPGDPNAEVTTGENSPESAPANTDDRSSLPDGSESHEDDEQSDTSAEEKARAVAKTLYSARAAIEHLIVERPVAPSQHKQVLAELTELQSALSDLLSKLD